MKFQATSIACLVASAAAFTVPSTTSRVAFSHNAKKSDYATETKTVIDLVFAELLLCYDITILQASGKSSDHWVNIVKQLALSCFHCGFLSQNFNS